MQKIENDTQAAQIFYGLHFAPGVAQYSEGEEEPYRILINENVAKKMDATFQGKPVYVRHVDEVDLTKFRWEAAGVVFDSFYNSVDGKHWVRFVVFGDEGLQAIKKGWTLSNAYVPGSFSNGGLWHGVPYQKEVMDAEYEHLAIVPDPRYAESVILTPEAFKAYNDKKEIELKKLTNSKNQKGEGHMGLNIFKRVKVENAKEVDFDSLCVTLPKSKKELTLTQVVNELDTVYNMHGYANGDHMVKVNDAEEMSVNDLVKRCGDMKNELEDMKKMNEPDMDMDDESLDNEEATSGEKLGEKEDDKMYANEEDEDDDKKKDKKMNASEIAEKRLANARKLVAEADAKNKTKRENFDKLKNAHKNATTPEETYVMVDKVQRGQELFGSN